MSSQPDSLWCCRFNCGVKPFPVQSMAREHERVCPLGYGDDL